MTCFLIALEIEMKFIGLFFEALILKRILFTKLIGFRCLHSQLPIAAEVFSVDDFLWNCDDCCA